MEKNIQDEMGFLAIWGDRLEVYRAIIRNGKEHRQCNVSIQVLG